jgi:hypothetical protein
MKKILFLGMSIFIFGTVFFVWENASARISDPPSRACTEKEITNRKCGDQPTAGKTYVFGSADYCSNKGSQNAENALSLIEYKKEFNALSEEEKTKIGKLLGDPKYRTGALVPCGRSCDDPTTEINEAADCDFCHFFALFKTIIDWVVYVIVPAIALLFVVLGGFIIATSRGNPGQSQKGKDMIIWTSVGIVVIFVGWMVINSFLAGIGVVDWIGLKGGLFGPEGGLWKFSCGT